MTAAYRLKGIGWFGAGVAVVLIFYLVSLQVAGERKKLEQINRRITAAERDIRALETEFDTRANLAQLEKWNGETLALSAPTAGQFVSDETALAALDVNGMPGEGVQVRTVALVVPSGVPAQPAMTLVAATAPVPTSQSVATAATAVTTRVAAVTPRAAPSAIVARTAAVAAKVQPRAVAMLDRKLLSDNTIGDILSGARTEAGLKH